MTDEGRDHPNVLVFPPLILAGTLLLGVLLQWAVPLGLLGGLDQTARMIVGAVLVAAGVWLAPVVGRRTLVRHGTNVSPLKPTIVLVTEGVFSWTRNPLYLGGTLVLVGLALLFALDWLLLLVPAALLLLHFGVVKREEHYLEAKFGDEYRHYKTRVPRYLWPV